MISNLNTITLHHVTPISPSPLQSRSSTNHPQPRILLRTGGRPPSPVAGSMSASTSNLPSSTLLSNHASTLSYYKSALSTAESRISALEATLNTLKSQLISTRTERDFYIKRVRVLDRDSRIHALELDAAHRARGECEKEIAGLRVEVEALKVERRGKRGRQNMWGVGWDGVDRGIQTDDEDDEGAGDDVCECGRRRRIRRKVPDRRRRRSTVEVRGDAQSAPVPPVPPVRRVRFMEPSENKKGKAPVRPVSAPQPPPTRTWEEDADDASLYELPRMDERGAYPQSIIGEERREKTKQLREKLKATRERLERKSFVNSLEEDYFDTQDGHGVNG